MEFANSIFYNGKTDGSFIKGGIFVELSTKSAAMKKIILLLGFVISMDILMAQQTHRSSYDSLAAAIFKQLVEINTTLADGDCGIAVEAMEKRLIAGGFSEKEMQIVGADAKSRNLVLRWRGTGNGLPVLFNAHLDVVPVRRVNWTVEPFQLTEKDGFFYGRGSADMKDAAAIVVADFIRLKREGFEPQRDLILALTCGEETSDEHNGVNWLLANQRPLIEAEYCVNLEGGALRIRNGKHTACFIGVGEKGYLDLKLETRSPGGHSSLPTKNNAIYRLAKGLTNLAAFEFPLVLDSITRSSLYMMSSLETGSLAEDLRTFQYPNPDAAVIKRLSAIPVYNGRMRNTCVVTVIEGGQSPSALPERATATVNCRVIAGDKQANVLRQIDSVLADSQIVVTVTDSLIDNPVSTVNPVLLKHVQQVTAKCWPGIPVIPIRGSGTTDGRLMRHAGIPTFGVSPVAIDIDDIRAHGTDERILVSAFYDGLEYGYWLIRAIGGDGR
jgi:acetylornithine deacetylase/succinyl-diaminopimelate desuccinylase-like protein